MSDDRPAPGRRPRPFRWQALFQRASDPFFVLDRRRRLRFVNSAWETLTGLSADQARGLPCNSPRPLPATAPLEERISHALTPPPEVLEGILTRTQRLFLAGEGTAPPVVLHLEFLPLRQAPPGEDFLILGRIVAVAAPTVPVPVLPERLLSVRQRVLDAHTLELLSAPEPTMQCLARQVRLAAALTAPVLLLGESGVGKQTIARVIHYLGRNRDRAFAALDCERLPLPDVLAVLIPSARMAARLAGLGAIYLREPSFLPREIQLQLCPRLTGEQGGPRLYLGCRVDPSGYGLVEEFQAAMRTLTIPVPPLRQRPTDLTRGAERERSRPGATGTATPRTLTPAAWQILRAYSWPGNFTELRSVMETARRHATGEWIDVADLPVRVRRAVEATGEPTEPLVRPVPLESTLEQVERRLIALALRRARGNRTRAAALLGLTRQRLLRRLEALHLEEGEEDSGESEKKEAE